MDIKLKNNYLLRGALVLAICLIALSCMLAFDIINHNEFIAKDPYFKSSKFTGEINNFFENVRAYHFTYKGYDTKTPEQKITKEELNSIKAQHEPILGQQEIEINQRFSADIEEAIKAGNKDRVNLLLEEKNRKLTEARNANTALIDKAVKELITNKDNDYQNIKRSLENSKSLKYYIKNETTGETYTNLTGVTDIERYIKNEAFYSIRFPLEPDQSRQQIYIDSFFKNNNLNGFFIVPKKVNGYNQMIASYNYYNSVRGRIILEIIMLIVTTLAAAALFIYLKRLNELNVGIIDTFSRISRKIPLDFRVIIFFITTFIALNYMAVVSFFYTPIGIGHLIKLTLSALFTVYIILVLRELYILGRDKVERQVQWTGSISHKCAALVRESFLYKNIIVKVLVIAISTTLFGMFIIIGFVGGERGSEEIALLSLSYILLYLFLVPYKVLKKTINISKIIKGTDEIVSGNLNYVIDENVGGNLSILAHNINNMKHGFKTSLESQMKSERMKSELITNVSHDLKTPLTSIINYVELLKREDLSQDELKGYVGVLDRKTQRLKVLIEDLFEASKMSSGSVELNIEKVDVAALLNQSLAEFDEKIKSSSLTFKVNVPRQKIYANLDGKKIWRVFENLINNALKYSQSNTRVYIDLTEKDNKVIFTIKNISSYEMDFDVEEIFERFKRADKSRHTEGSGLGLAIAKSIVELHSGSLNIEVDGDLFKAIVELNK